MLDTIREETAFHVDALRSLIRNPNVKDLGGKNSEYPEGSWAVSLGLLGGSTPIVGGINARLVIPPARIAGEVDVDQQVRERDLVEDHLQRRDVAVQTSPRPPCKDPSCDLLVAPCFSCKRGFEKNTTSHDVSADRNAETSSYLSRLLSRLQVLSISPSNQADSKAGDGSVELGLRHYPFEKMFKGPQLLAPALPLYPSIFKSDKGKDVCAHGIPDKESRVRACALDMLASFEDCDEAFE